MKNVKCWVSLLFSFFWDVFLPGFHRRALQIKALFIGKNRETILLFLEEMLKSVEDSEKTHVNPVINPSLPPGALIWRSWSCNQPVSTMAQPCPSLTFLPKSSFPISGIRCCPGNCLPARRQSLSCLLCLSSSSVAVKVLVLNCHPECGNERGRGIEGWL